MKKIMKLRLRTTITLLVTGVIIVCYIVTNEFIKQNVQKTTMARIEEKARNISRTVALSPIVIEGLSLQDKEKSIQIYTEKVRKATKVPFIVVLDMNGVRKSHPDPKKIGEKFVGGDDKPVYSGKENLSVAEGTLGMSLRYFTPVYNEDGKQIGVVAVGILLDEVEKQLHKSSKIVYSSAVIGLLIGLIGAILLATKVKKIMFGMEPDEIANHLEQRNAMLHHVREGILAVDRNSIITLLNEEADRLLKQSGIFISPVGRNVADIIPKFDVTRVIETGEKELDKEYSFNGLQLVAGIVPIYVDNQIVGAIATFRDKTEMKLMAEQLTGARLYAEALRAQTHEFMNKLHVIIGLIQIELYDQLLDYVKGLKNSCESEADFFTSHFKDSILAGFLLGKASYAREKGVQLNFSDECYLPAIKNKEMIKNIVTILGNLIDNALDALIDSEKKNVFIKIIQQENGQMLISVTDTGIGINREVLNSIYEKGFSTKGAERGFGLYLVRQSVKELNGSIDIASEEGSGTKFTVLIPFENRSDSK